MILICLLYTCGVWIESVDPVADLCITNQVLKVKNDPRSEFSNLSNWKEEA